MPASATTCKLARQEPSFSSRKEKPFESRRVRTQPLISTLFRGSVAARIRLISVRISPLGKSSPIHRHCELFAKTIVIKHTAVLCPVFMNQSCQLDVIAAILGDIQQPAFLE